MSFTGNDAGFGDIVSHCIMGYKSRDPCQGNIASALKILQNNTIYDLVFEVLEAIKNKLIQSEPNKRFIVYCTGYAEFFSAVDTTCDKNYMHEWTYFGEYLTQALRRQLNELAAELNTHLRYAIQAYKRKAGLSRGGLRSNR